MGLLICMNGNQRTRERVFVLDNSNVRAESKILPSWLNLVYLAIGACALWRLVRVFWIG